MTSGPGWDDEPFPGQSADDLDRGWGEGTGENAGFGADPDADADHDERLLRDVPPHHGD